MFEGINGYGGPSIMLESSFVLLLLLQIFFFCLSYFISLYLEIIGLGCVMQWHSSPQIVY